MEKLIRCQENQKVKVKLKISKDLFSTSSEVITFTLSNSTYGLLYILPVGNMKYVRLEK